MATPDSLICTQQLVLYIKLQKLITMDKNICYWTNLTHCHNLIFHFFSCSALEFSMDSQESFESDKNPSIGSRDSNDPLEDDSDDSGSPPGGSFQNPNSPSLHLPNGNITPILVCVCHTFLFENKIMHKPTRFIWTRNTTSRWYFG